MLTYAKERGRGPHIMIKKGGFGVSSVPWRGKGQKACRHSLE
jgi:hypothetical protein